MASRRRPAGIALAVLACMAPASASAAAATLGAASQLPGAQGCVTATGGRSGCATGGGLEEATAVAVAPDNKQVYVASASADAVAAFRRDATTGALAQAAGTRGCVSATGS